MGSSSSSRLGLPQISRARARRDFSPPENGPQGVEEILGAGFGAHLGDDLLDVGQAQLVLLEQIQAVLHQLVVVGLVAGGATQFGDAGARREFDPDFRDEDTFEVETDELHGG